MPKLRAIAAFAGAALFAGGLSFGASLAAGDPHVAAAAPGKHYTPAGVCVLVEPPKD